jgi:hypothetical protein
MSSEPLEALAEINPEALLADGLEDAFIGYTLNHHHAHVAVYDYDKCIDILVARDGMTSAEPDKFLSFNTLDASVGENGPLFIRMFNDPQA